VELGNHDGFPAYGDPQDHVYLPLPGEVRVRKPAAVAEGLPRISVVCTGDDEARLRAAVQSVLWQGYPGVEAVVAADPSRDLPAGADHVRRWQPHAALSTSAVINEGFGLSHGDVLGWLRPGDLLSDAALWEIGAAFAADPDLDVVCANALCLDEANRPRVVRCGNARTAFAFGQTDPAAELAQHGANAHMLPQPAIFCRRRLLERVGALNPSYEHVFDLEFWWRVARTGTARKIQKTLVLCRLPEQAALRDEQGRRTEWRRLRRSLGLESAQAHRPWPRVLGGYVLRGLRNRLGSRQWRAAG
jgi:hypothetical protein